MNAQSIHQSTEDERQAALTKFFSAVRTAARESDVAAAKPALTRLAEAIVGRDNGQALAEAKYLFSNLHVERAWFGCSNAQSAGWQFGDGVLVDAPPRRFSRSVARALPKSPPRDNERGFCYR